MRRSIVFGLFGSLFSMVFAGIFVTNGVWAAVQTGNCSNITKSMNDSIYDACRLSVNDPPRGTMWISSNSNEKDVSSKVVVDDWESGDGKVDVYLHGAIIRGGKARGTYIKIVRSDNEIKGTADRYDEYAPLMNVPSTMERYGNTSPETVNIRSSVQTIKLDVRKMMEVEKTWEEADGYRIYKIPIQAFRCYEGYMPSVGEGGCYSSGSTLRVEVWVTSKFEGKTQVTGATMKTTGYSDDSKTEFATIENCSPMEGCRVKFKHSLRRAQGSGESAYTISRSSNFIGVNYSDKAIESNDELKYGWFNAKEADVMEDTLTLYPGMVICEKMTFDIDDVKYDNRYTRLCVSALGSVETSLDMKVKNDSMGGNYAKQVYAKPGDNLSYRATYTPALQYVYRVRPGKMKIDDGKYIANGKPCNTVVASSTLAGYCQLGVLYNGKRGDDLKGWKNGFTMFSDDFEYSEDYRYNNGDDGIKVEYNDKIVSKSDVGKSLKGQVSTNRNNSVKITPKKVTFVAGNNNVSMASVNIKAKLDTGSIEDSARVLVPYNFKNETRIEAADDVVYAGEKANVKYEIVTGTRENPSMEATYATMVRDAKWKAEICYGENYENCVSEEPTSGNLHENEGIYDEALKSDESTKVTVDIPDVPAGTKVQMKACVYPASSGDDLNWQDPEGDHQWSCTSKELTVAKKPSFQVWGGSVYSAGDIKLRNYVSNKNKLAGYEDGVYVFGSWTELGLMASGTATGLASGAGLGYSGLGLEANPGGGSNNDYCKMSTLSFANNNCSDNIGSLKETKDVERSDLISAFVPENDDEFEIPAVSAFDLGENEEKYKVNEGLYYYHKNNDVRLGAPSGIDSGVVKVVKANGDIRIAGNIFYKDREGGNTALGDISKVILYTDKDIIIECVVERVDAVLIAGGNVKTCDSDDVNSVRNSKQLVINGAIIADTLVLSRTYGAATGVDSIVPAEIINYDTSLYLWANGKSSVTETGKIVTAYQTELSPRY